MKTNESTTMKLGGGNFDHMLLKENRKKVKNTMIVGNILQDANKKRVHAPDSEPSAENVLITYKALQALEKKVKEKRVMQDEDYSMLRIIEKSKNALIKLVSLNLTEWDKKRYLNVGLPEFEYTYGTNKDVYELLTGERYIYSRVVNRLSGVELAGTL